MEVFDENERSLSEDSLDLDSIMDLDAEETVSSVAVTNITLKNEYLKIQRKRVEGSQQRIEDGVVRFTICSLMQIVNVRTFVQRLADWAGDIACNRPDDGWSELYTKLQVQKGGTYNYMADLDSVYKNQEGDYVYALVKNKGNNIRNAYVFFVVVELVDQTVASFCYPFLLKTKPAIRSREHSHGS